MNTSHYLALVAVVLFLVAGYLSGERDEKLRSLALALLAFLFWLR